jgi:hypothetical protein
MAVTFTFALSQQQTFELRCDYGSRRLDKVEVGLINKLASKFERFEGVPALLNQPGISFKGRLQNFFEAIEDTHDQPLLLVLDDFEQNIPQKNIEDGSLRMTAEAYGVLEALCAAERRDKSPSLQ